MIREEMTVHEALAELKTLDARILKQIESKFCATKSNSSAKINGGSVEDYNKETQQAFQSVGDLIKRRRALKNAIVVSNAKTYIDIDGEKYLVAEAIEIKKGELPLKDRLLSKLERDYQTAALQCEMQNEDVKTKAQNWTESLYKDKDNKNADNANKLLQEFIKENSWDIVDPIDIKSKIAALTDEVNLLGTKIDAKLSVSNAITTIQIEY